MPESIGTLVAGIEVPTQKLNSSLKKATSMFASAGKKMGKALSVGIIAGVALATFAIIKLGKSSIKLASEQETSNSKLRQSLANLGDTSQTTFKSMQALAGEIQNLTVFGDEAIQDMISIGLAMDVPIGRTKEFVKGVIGLQKSFDLKLKPAQQAMAALMQGNTAALTTIIPILRSVTDENERLAIASQKAKDGFKIAQEEAKTAAGRFEQFKGVVGDVQQALAKDFLPIITNVFLKLRIFLQENTEAIAKWGKDAAASIKIWIDGMGGIEGVLKKVGTAIKTTIKWVKVLTAVFVAFAAVTVITKAIAAVVIAIKGIGIAYAFASKAAATFLAFTGPVGWKVLAVGALAAAAAIVVITVALKDRNEELDATNGKLDKARKAAEEEKKILDEVLRLEAEKIKFIEQGIKLLEQESQNEAIRLQTQDDIIKAKKEQIKLNNKLNNEGKTIRLSSVEGGRQRFAHKQLGSIPSLSTPSIGAISTPSIGAISTPSVGVQENQTVGAIRSFHTELLTKLDFMFTSFINDRNNNFA